MTALGQIPASDNLVTKNHAHPVGIVLPFGQEVAVDANGELSSMPGWLMCRGQAIASGNFPALDALIGAAAPAGMVHAFNGGGSPGAGLFRVPNLQRALPLHKNVAGQTGSTIGGPAGGGSFGSGWDHSHAKSTLAMAAHYHSPGSLTMANHWHTHNLYEGDHTHQINNAAWNYFGPAGSYANNHIGQTSTGMYTSDLNTTTPGPFPFQGAFPTDGGGGLDNRRTGGASVTALSGTATGTSTGPAGPYLMVNFIVKA